LLSVWQQSVFHFSSSYFSAKLCVKEHVSSSQLRGSQQCGALDG
jgi:hypothetical protein